MRIMRTFLIAIALLATVAIVPAPAAALSGCSNVWTGSATCFFKCDDVNLYVRGHAQNLGAPASVTVTAECGIIDIFGNFLPLQTLSCTASGPGSASCFSSAPYTFFPTSLVGRCTVTGAAGGAYGCVSAP